MHFMALRSCTAGSNDCIITICIITITQSHLTGDVLCTWAKLEKRQAGAKQLRFIKCQWEIGQKLLVDPMKGLECDGRWDKGTQQCMKNLHERAVCQAATGRSLSHAVTHAGNGTCQGWGWQHTTPNFNWTAVYRSAAYSRYLLPVSDAFPVVLQGRLFDYSNKMNMHVNCQTGRLKHCLLWLQALPTLSRN